MSREKILQDIREALRAPMHLDDDSGPSWPPAPPEEKKDIVATFREKFEAVGGVWVESVDAMLGQLQGAKKVWLAKDAPGELEEPLTKAGIEVSRSVERNAADSIDAVITGVDRAIAETGSFGIVVKPGHGRLPSVISPIHVVFATREQFVETLDDWMAYIKPLAGERSWGVLVTGPSRTGDIEGILVIGVHGPTKLVAVVL